MRGTHLGTPFALTGRRTQADSRPRRKSTKVIASRRRRRQAEDRAGVLEVQALERRRSADAAGDLASHPMTQPRVELLFWDGCPSHPQALEQLRAAMADVGLDPEQVLVREVDTDQGADRERFVGSPTIRVDGADVQDPGDEPAALTCRVYRRRDGRVSPVPDPADVRDALRNAMTTRSHQ
jgi:hypothetical protein